MRGAARAVLGLALIAALSVATAAPSAAGEWHVYRNPSLGFQVLYPGSLRILVLDRRTATHMVVAALWTRAGAASVTRLTLIDRLEGLTLAQWMRREQRTRAIEYTVAGQKAFIVESLFDGRLTTDVWFTEPKSGKIINFTHTISNIADWRGRPLNAVKNRHRPDLADFWNMVESIKFAD